MIGLIDLKALENLNDKMIVYVETCNRHQTARNTICSKDK